MNHSSDLTKKRLVSLVRTWSWLVQKGLVDGTRFVLNASLASKAVMHYADDLAILKIRYGIPDKAQMPKVAGLMASAISRYRPIVPVNGRESVSGFDGNEWLAIFHGIAVCAKTDKGVNSASLSSLEKQEMFVPWLDRFRYLLHERNHTPEALAMVFETLCLTVFPSTETTEL
jgi:hypothetical protein